MSPKKDEQKQVEIGERAHELMKQHEEEAHLLLDEQWEQQVPAHVIYTLAVLVGAFLLNLVVLIIVSGG